MSGAWMPIAVSLAVAVSIALVFLLLNRRTRDEGKARPSDDTHAAYLAKVQALKDLEVGAPLMAPADVQAQRAALEREAAELLSRRMAEPAPRPAATASFFRAHPALTGAIGGGLAVGFVAVAFSVLRANPQAGAPPTPPAEARDAPLDALAQAAASQPDNPDKLGALVMALLRRQNFDEAAPLVAPLSVLDPYNVKGRIARAVMGAFDARQSKPSIEELRRLARTYPEAYDAHLFAGLFLAQDGDRTGAASELEAYLGSAPPDEHPAMVTGLLKQMRERGD